MTGLQAKGTTMVQAGSLREADLATYVDSYHPDNCVNVDLRGAKRNDLSMTNYKARNAYTHHYAWAIPSYEAIIAIAAFAPRILEVGAGSGLWASLLKMAGVHVQATDAQHNSTHWVPTYTQGKYYRVQAMNHRRATRTYRNDYALMMCWPPYDTAMSHESIERHVGDKIVYIGEGDYGCTGTARMHQLLDRHWNVKERIYIPTWTMVSDSLTLYTRKVGQ